MSERSGHLAPRGARFRVITSAPLHLARWSLEPLLAGIAPGFSCKGAAAAFHLLGLFVITGARFWPGTRQGAGDAGN